MNLSAKAHHALHLLKVSQQLKHTYGRTEGSRAVQDNAFTIAGETIATMQPYEDGYATLERILGLRDKKAELGRESDAYIHERNSAWDAVYMELNAAKGL